MSSPKTCLNDARKQADAFNDDVVPEGRKDLTKMLTITIDPFDARDFDDAISLQREEGRWRLWVHIADVSQFRARRQQAGRGSQEARDQRLSARSRDPDDSRNHQQSLGQPAARPHAVGEDGRDRNARMI